MEASAAALSSRPIPAPGADEADVRYLPGPKVAARYDVSDMTLYRWLRDERMQFPQPHYFGRLRYWKLSDLTAWERERVSARPQANAR